MLSSLISDCVEPTGIIRQMRQLSHPNKRAKGEHGLHRFLCCTGCWPCMQAQPDPSLTGLPVVCLAAGYHTELVDSHMYSLAADPKIEAALPFLS